MQTVEIGADTKSCRDISRLFKDYLVTVLLEQSHLVSMVAFSSQLLNRVLH